MWQLLYVLTVMLSIPIGCSGLFILKNWHVCLGISGQIIFKNAIQLLVHYKVARYDVVVSQCKMSFFLKYNYFLSDLKKNPFGLYTIAHSK